MQQVKGLDKKYLSLSAWICLLIAVSLVVLRERFLNISSSILMADTDTQGTMWWVWAQCGGNKELLNSYASGSTNSLIGFPAGFDFSALPFSNLIDDFRLLLLKTGSCSPQTLVTVFNLTPIVAVALNAIAGFFVGRSAGLISPFAFLTGLAAGLTPVSLLATRTSISNNVLFFGLFALAFIYSYREHDRRRYLYIASILLLLQAWSNLYNGFFLTLVCLITLVSSSIHFRTKWKKMLVEVITVTVPTLIFTLYEFVPDILFLAKSDNAEIYRPVNFINELLNPEILFGRPQDWLPTIRNSGTLVYDAGWIPLVCIVLVLLATLLMLVVPQGPDVIFKWKLNLGIAILALTLTHAFIPFGFLNVIYFKFFGLLRGASNYDKFTILFLVLSSLIVIQATVDSKRTFLDESISNRYTKLLIPTLSIGMGILLVADSLPTSPTFRERNTISPILYKYKSVESSLTDKVLVHIPDRLYGGDWGFPSGHIQIAQIIHGQRILNGREFTFIDLSCAALPTPLSPSDINFLENRGAQIIVVHTDLVAPEIRAPLNKFLDYSVVEGQLTEIIVEPFQGMDIPLNKNSELARSYDFRLFEITGSTGKAKISCR